jgi:hypothetical protein
MPPLGTHHATCPLGRAQRVRTQQGRQPLLYFRLRYQLPKSARARDVAGCMMCVAPRVASRRLLQLRLRDGGARHGCALDDAHPRRAHNINGSTSSGSTPVQVTTVRHRGLAALKCLVDSAELPVANRYGQIATTCGIDQTRAQSRSHALQLRAHMRHTYRWTFELALISINGEMYVRTYVTRASIHGAIVRLSRPQRQQFGRLSLGIGLLMIRKTCAGSSLRTAHGP